MKADREKLRLAMARKCLTSAELANQAGVPRSTANNVISGRNVRPVTIGQIAKALNVDVLDLLDTTEPHRLQLAHAGYVHYDAHHEYYRAGRQAGMNNQKIKEEPI